MQMAESRIELCNELCASDQISFQSVPSFLHLLMKSRGVAMQRAVGGKTSIWLTAILLSYHPF